MVTPVMISSIGWGTYLCMFKSIVGFRLALQTTNKYHSLRGRKLRLLLPHLVSHHRKQIMRIPTDNLQLLLPGNQGPITRGDRHHFRQGLRREHDLCQSGQRATSIEQRRDRCKSSGVWLSRQ
jgi:hypothetical protein